MKQILFALSLLITLATTGQVRKQVYPIVATQATTPVAAATAAANPTRFHFAHVAVSLFHQQGSILASMRKMKEQGINAVWLHNDQWNDVLNTYYNISTDSAVLAAAYLGGIFVIPGFMTASTSTANVKDMITDYFNRAGILRINGKPVFCGYDYNAYNASPSFNQVSMDSMLTRDEGIQKSDYILICNSTPPFSEDYWATKYGEATNLNGVKSWAHAKFWDIKSGVAPEYHATNLSYQITDWPWTDGLMVFAGDLEPWRLIRYNQHVCDVANSKKLEGGAWVGYGLFYASISFYDYHLDSLAAIGAAIINMPLNRRPRGLGGIWNDNSELNYDMLSQNDTAGIFYVPTTRGAFYGDASAARAPLMDHSGINAFFSPYMNAFLNDQQTITIPTDRIICKYQLHPKNASFISTIPAAATARGYNQTQWDGTMYKNGSAQITGIKTIPGVDDIEMGAHLTRPAYLKINGTLSSLMPAGVATFRIALSSFTGYPTFQIIEPDGVTIRKSATGPQAISTSCYPGGWNPLIREL